MFEETVFLPRHIIGYIIDVLCGDCRHSRLSGTGDTGTFGTRRGAPEQAKNRTGPKPIIRPASEVPK
uniref:Uncharacterized protein n=1 Tax=Candidatus Kentrum sp. TC TaxID=2126339 RepID=A0A451AEE3_9GAMM|nr:MAG: hypothetical protein BECKTC1821F_GA0114240_11242 [Candidatus Kentron sp. TC]